MGVLLDKTVGKAVNALFNGAVKGVSATAKGVGKATMAVGGVSSKVVTKVGEGAIDAGKAIAGTSVKGVKGAGKMLTKELSEEALENATLYERVAGRKLNAGGIAVVAGGTMLASTINAAATSGKSAKLGHVSVGENLDRLVSYDGSGALNKINEMSGGDYEVMSDIVSNTFNNPNQFGATGDIVFALHNMREG